MKRKAESAANPEAARSRDHADRRFAVIENGTASRSRTGDL